MDVRHKKFRRLNEALRRDRFGFIYTFSYLERGGRKMAKIINEQIKRSGL
jgi:hypothetical protein